MYHKVKYSYFAAIKLERRAFRDFFHEGMIGIVGIGFPLLFALEFVCKQTTFQLLRLKSAVSLKTSPKISFSGYHLLN